MSNPLKCDVDLYNAQLPAYPLTEDEFTARLKRNCALRQSCIDRTGMPLVDYMDTVSIAKDHEAVRIALGGEPINYFGVSYGTLLGAQYAELFPNNIRSMMLDSVASLSQSEIETFASAIMCVETAFKSFLSWCASQDATACPMAHYDPGKTLEQVWMDLIARVQEKPLPCSDSKTCYHPDMTVDEIRAHTYSLLYSGSTFPNLSEAIGHALNQNDASVFAGNAILLTSPSKSQTVYNNSAAYSSLAVVCQDWHHDDKSVEDIKIKHMIARSQTPLMMGVDPAYSLFQVNCIGWPAATRNPPHKISIPRTASMPTILMVESFHDPAAPLTWGAQMRSEIGTDRTVMIAKNMTGHGVYEQPDTVGGEIAAVMEQYLLKLALPVEGTIYQS